MTSFISSLSFSLTFITLISAQIILPVVPTENLIIERTSPNTATISLPLAQPILAPTTTEQHTAAIDVSKLSAGEIATLSSPGFKIGDSNSNEAITILPPAIGNWHDKETPFAMSTIIIAPTPDGNTTIIVNNSMSSNDTLYAGPWAALTDRVNITINTTQDGNITITPASPTWISIQNDRERGLASTWPGSRASRPFGFPSPPMHSGNQTYPYNITIRGNITSFNLTINNMTHVENKTQEGGWAGMWQGIGTGMDGRESIIHGNLTGSGVNITITTPNATTIISTDPHNGSVLVNGSDITKNPRSNITSAASLSYAPSVSIALLSIMAVALVW